MIFGFIIFTSNFEITPITPKICDLKIIDKNINIDFNIDLEEDIINRIIKLNNFNSPDFRSTCADDNPVVSRASKMCRIPTFSEINYFNKFYKINLYENTSHIIAHICLEIKDKNLFKNN
jgi:hypothetical protein